MRGLAIVIYVVGGLISFFWSVGVVVQELGFIGGCIAFIIAPITIVFAPFYVGFTQGNWTLLAITYGCGIVASIMFAVGDAVDDSEDL